MPMQPQPVIRRAVSEPHPHRILGAEYDCSEDDEPVLPFVQGLFEAFASSGMSWPRRVVAVRQRHKRTPSKKIGVAPVAGIEPLINKKPVRRAVTAPAVGSMRSVSASTAAPGALAALVEEAIDTRMPVAMPTMIELEAKKLPARGYVLPRRLSADVDPLACPATVDGLAAPNMRGVSRRPWSVVWDAHILHGAPGAPPMFLGGYDSPTSASRAHDLALLLIKANSMPWAPGEALNHQEYEYDITGLIDVPPAYLSPIFVSSAAAIARVGRQSPPPAARVITAESEAEAEGVRVTVR